MSRPGKTVNRAALAQTFGVSLPTVEKWVRAGCPHLERGGLGKEWQFDTAAVHRWLLDRHAEAITAAYTGKGDGKISIDEARRRTAIATMRVAEIEAAREEKGVVDVAYVAAIYAETLAVLSAQLNTLGARIAGRAAALRDPNAIQALTEGALVEIIGDAQQKLSAAVGGAPLAPAAEQPQTAPAEPGAAP